MVFDHLAHPPLPAGIDHPSHGIVRELIDKGRTWVKLSGAYSNSKVGPPPIPRRRRSRRHSSRRRRSAWCGAATGRTPACASDKPDDAVLFDLLAVWAPDEATRNRILVQNPEALYGFGKPA